MKNKIVGICICTLLITTSVLPISGALNKKTIIETVGIIPLPNIEFIDPPCFNLRKISVGLLNTGNATAQDIKWSMFVTRGIFFFPRSKENVSIGSLGPDQEYIIEQKLTGLGFGNISFVCEYKINTTKGSLDVGTKHELVDLALIGFNFFLTGAQPVITWEDVDDYEYKSIPVSHVNLTKYGINRMHNVRVVKNDTSGIVLFPPVICKFLFEGYGELVENHITKDIVESGIGKWEIELVNGA